MGLAGDKVHEVFSEMSVLFVLCAFDNCLKQLVLVPSRNIKGSACRSFAEISKLNLKIEVMASQN
jgi:hypothetical protein